MPEAGVPGAWSIVSGGSGGRSGCGGSEPVLQYRRAGVRRIPDRGSRVAGAVTITHRPRTSRAPVAAAVSIRFTKLDARASEIGKGARIE